MPLLIRVPRRYRSGAPRVDQKVGPAANIDLAPTILDLAHGRRALPRPAAAPWTGAP